MIVTAYSVAGFESACVALKRELRLYRFLPPRSSPRRASDGMILDLDEDDCAYAKVALNDEQKEFLEQVLHEACEDVSDVLFAMPRRQKSETDYVEVGGMEASGICRLVQQGGWKVKHLSPVDYDMSGGVSTRNAFTLCEKQRPMWMMLQLPHRAFDDGASDGSGVRTARRLQRGRKLLRNFISLLKDQIARGGEWIVIAPTSSRVWKERDCRGLLHDLMDKGQSYVTTVGGAISGGQKGTMRLITSSQSVQQRMSMMNREHRVEKGDKMLQGLVEGMLSPEATTNECAFGLRDEPLLDDALTPEGKKRAQKLLRTLHVRSGHPSNQTLASMLRGRGVHHEIVKMALEMQCQDCLETRLATPPPAVSLQQSEVPWKVIVLDNAEFRVGDQVIHFMLIVDEATHLATATEIFRRHVDEGRNATGEEALLAIEKSWIQMFGYPDRIRLDPEGCFRSRLLEDWAAERGIEIFPNPGEAHHQTGLVESLIGKIKADATTLLHGEEMDPYRAILNMVTAHNSIHRVQGFSAAQWAFGRDFSFGGRLFESDQQLPAIERQADPRHAFGQSLNTRMAAEEVYRKSTAAFQLSRLLNMRTRSQQTFLPGDVVFYRREKVPADKPAHETLGIPKAKMARWWGPGRVVASETRSDEKTRRPAQVVWIVSAGRLKRCSPDQLRHASDREQILADSAHEQVTPGWTFHSLMQGLGTGHYDIYDDYVLPEDRSSATFRRTGSRAPRPRTPARSVAPHPPDAEMEGIKPRAEVSSRKEVPRAEVSSRKEVPRAEVSSRKEVPRAEVSPRIQSTSSGSGGQGEPFSLQKYLQDPSYEPDIFRKAMERRAHSPTLGDLLDEPRFKQARAQHERRDRPLHVIQREGQAGLPSHSVQDAQPDPSFLGYMEEMQEDESIMCSFDVALPEKESQWKRFRRDPSAWLVKGMRKQEVQYKRLGPEERAGFDKAKEAEVEQWVKEMAAKKVSTYVPPERVMRMRWVLTYKDTGAPKARMVLVGFEDPDLETLVSSSPTMSRRTRQMFYLMTKLQGWSSMKADVKAAFLQGSSSQLARNVFARPTPELAKALDVPEGHAIQIVEAAYGLVNAPAEWFRDVNRTLTGLGMQQLKSEPCAWRLVKQTPAGPRLIGLIAAHVGDFLLSGNEACEEWHEVVSKFYTKYRWSPWEVSPYNHCGVRIQESNNEVTMDQSTYCGTLEQIEYQKRDENLPASAEEVSQLRGLLGGIQWRAYSTAPQHLAVLSMLQSQVSKATVKTLMMANKLCREVYHQRQNVLKVVNLEIAPEDVTFVAWCDAAVGNRPNLASTGGYVIAATTPEILKGNVAPTVPVAWRSGKLPRVARSSLSAETQACSEAEEELMYVRFQWYEMCGHPVDLRKAAETARNIAGVIVTDARSLYDILHKEDLNSSAGGLREKYTALEALSLVERIRLAATEVRWVHSDAQVADGMTKPNPSGSLYAFLQLGKWRLIYDPTFTAAKKLRKQGNLRL